MGVDPYLIAPTLKLAIAQRLARRLCPNTGKEMKVEGAVKVMVDKAFETLPKQYRDRIPESTTMMHPEPSTGCASGTKGRVAVMEVFEVNEDIQELILNGGSEEEMFLAARKNGFTTMKEDAIIKALEHIIPYEEMNVFGSKVSMQIEEDESIVISDPQESYTDSVQDNPGASELSINNDLPKDDPLVL